ncbi:TPA: hypothetical protein N0F65_003244 [Lagenidium giganteum]|uniref:Transposase n=1 Tax=Lagenidium giganteum TaxID=4803 RepID=A0AAV2Z6S7_9STRA|nr:TPA: hypothetical protein N0F65_003244 [Lagenidium giganteum]
MDVTGLIAWGSSTHRTFDRFRFHEVFQSRTAPMLNPWPLPRSIVGIDNAKIHMYTVLEELIHQRGALLFFPVTIFTSSQPNRAFRLKPRWNLVAKAS